MVVNFNRSISLKFKQPFQGPVIIAVNMGMAYNVYAALRRYAIKKGVFYASSGIMLKNIGLIDEKTISLSAASPRVANTTFCFIGKDGRLLKKEQPSGPETPASYTVQGDEGYVRVEASREDGAQAWTQPFWVE